MMQPTPEQQEVQTQAGKIPAQIAGYVGVRTIEMGLRLGLIPEIANHAQGITAANLATHTGMDPLYIQVWCRSAYASVGVDGDAHSLGQTQDRTNEAGLQGRISLTQSTFEDVSFDSEFDFSEALIDDQLMPTQAYVDLLNKHNYRNVDAFSITPAIHAVTYGQK